MYGHTYSKSMDQPGKVANLARGQLNRKNEYSPVRVRAWEFSLARRFRQSRPVEGCPLRRMLQRGLGRLLSIAAVSEAISGSRAVHTCCCSYCCMAGDLALADQAQLSNIYCHKRDIN